MRGSSPQQGQEVAENVINDLLKEASNTTKEPLSTSYDRDKCEGKLTLREKLVEHIGRVHAKREKESHF